MQVVITSTVSKSYGLTFNVDKINFSENGNPIFVVHTPDGNIFQLHCDDIVVVDFQKEYQRSYDMHNFGTSSLNYKALKKYSEYHQIKFKPQ